MRNKDKSRKAVDNKVKVFGTTITAIVVAVMFILVFSAPKPVMVQNDEGSWHVIWKVSSANAAEFSGFTAGNTSWLATFVLDYEEDPTVCLLSNATNGAYDGWDNVSGYQNADNADPMDLPSEDPGYFVVRGVFNRTHVYNTDKFMDNRASIRLTVSGDETISDVEGTRIVSYNETDGDYIYINFYWDDESDGYRITDDGSLVWNITISAQF